MAHVAHIDASAPTGPAIISGILAAAGALYRSRQSMIPQHWTKPSCMA
jgi:hypothetical protein